MQLIESIPNGIYIGKLKIDLLQNLSLWGALSCFQDTWFFKKQNLWLAVSRKTDSVCVVFKSEAVSLDYATKKINKIG